MKSKANQEEEVKLAHSTGNEKVISSRKTSGR